MNTPQRSEPFQRLVDKLRPYDPTGGALAGIIAVLAFLAAGIGALLLSFAFIGGVLVFSNSQQLNPVAVYGIASFGLLLVCIVVALIVGSRHSSRSSG